MVAASRARAIRRLHRFGFKPQAIASDFGITADEVRRAVKKPTARDRERHQRQSSKAESRRRRMMRELRWALRQPNAEQAMQQIRKTWAGELPAWANKEFEAA